MIFRLEKVFRRVHRWLSRSELAIGLLRLTESVKTTTKPGLIMIQIDGLSHTQLLRGLKKKKMPFLCNLLDNERYRLHLQYSGLPSSTPAVQGELFYGVRGAVPAFSFKDRKSGNIVCMYEPGPTASVEKQLEKKGTPLLQGGSVYSSIYTGGASESHFCPSAFGWGDLFSKAPPVLFFLLLFSHIYSFIRATCLLIIEFFLAVWDCISGLINGHSILQEIKFVSTRVAICIVLREWITIGAKIDIARGLPIIHLNFLGYDEQAHRRGPSSLFAHWALRGIDDAIARIWRASKRSRRRSYDVWIYSDHGQEECLSYAKEHNKSIEEAVSELVSGLAAERNRPSGPGRGIQTQRVRQLGGKKIQKILPIQGEQTVPPKDGSVSVAAMGPVALVYLASPLLEADSDHLGADLVNKAHVPLVLAAQGPGRVKAWTSEGEFFLPDQVEAVLGADHPFLEEAGTDLIELCHHPDTGDFVLCGWRKGLPPYSFPLENGSHGGAGPEETKAFAILPDDTVLPGLNRHYLRPYDLRQAAFHHLGRVEKRVKPRPARQTGIGQRLRVLTYNVHSCIGMDGNISPERIARVIAQHKPDIVALQEVDVGKVRTNGVDQAHLIAKQLQMDFHFHTTVRVEEEQYGDAILTHLPMRLVKIGKLPGLAGKPHLETRGAIWVEIEFAGLKLQCINTHLGLLGKERMAQIQALLGEDWLGHPDCRSPSLICGDFNALPTFPVCRMLARQYNDVQAKLPDHKPLKTFGGRYPLARIDHIFIDQHIKVLDIDVPENELARVASDHMPLIAELEIKLG
ncbi:MAG: endonuclease/exonuclease/phosphatase family protein [Desulfobulbaceae bacterium]|jgi:endonuclease/exonuclease/phosphatase family metal-dependent hydrolase|nr:endonuclease/exonuclease/phosphatase family protein [Desulfobulbaceae bacterium]